MTGSRDGHPVLTGTPGTLIAEVACPSSACLAEITRLGYRQQVTYQPSSRFWAFQWYETGIYTALALGLAGFCSGGSADVDNRRLS